MEPISMEFTHGEGYQEGLAQTGEGGRGREEEVVSPCPGVAPAGGSERMSEPLPGRPLLIRAKLQVLGGQFETQRVGSQRVNHVLVAFPAVLHEERTPVGLGRADQLQTLQRSDRNAVRNSPKMAADHLQAARTC